MDPENENFEKMKKTLEHIIILQMFNINDSHIIYGFSDMECNKIFCHFGPFSALLAPPTPHFSPNNPENQNFEKLEKAPGFIIILPKENQRS